VFLSQSREITDTSKWPTFTVEMTLREGIGSSLKRVNMSHSSVEGDTFISTGPAPNWARAVSMAMQEFLRDYRGATDVPLPLSIEVRRGIISRVKEE
jgi:hypothetical protein